MHWSYTRSKHLRVGLTPSEVGQLSPGDPQLQCLQRLAERCLHRCFHCLAHSLPLLSLSLVRTFDERNMATIVVVVVVAFKAPSRSGRKADPTITCHRSEQSVDVNLQL